MKLPVRVRAEGAGPAFRAALDQLAAYAAAELEAWQFPGMTVSLLGPAGEVGIASVGLSRPETGEPVTPDQLFQIGSISKSFVALALLRLADQGRIDLDRPVLQYAPDMPIADGRVTATHILSHAAGFPGNAPPFPRETGGKLWTATAPGSRFSYSNSGYDTLALLIERASGKGFRAAMQALVLDPLGMTATRPTIRGEDRADYARSYVPLRMSVVHFPGGPLVEGPWPEIDRAAGSVASTPEDMARYMAFIAACATGRPQGLLSRPFAARFVGHVVDAPDFGPGARYGMGLASFDVAGAPVLHHTGGMITFSSAVTVDRGGAGGAFASVNITGFLGYRPRKVTAYGVQLARALATGAALPPVPSAALESPTGPDVTGRWAGPGLAFELVQRPEGLVLLSGDGAGRLKPGGPRRFLTDHPRFQSHLLAFEGETGVATRLWWGDVLLARDAAPEQPARDPALARFAGRYWSNDPWVGDVSFVVQGNRLVQEGMGPLVRHADGSWRYADPEHVTERVWFDSVVNGRAQRASLSGEPMMRLA
jgi:CubicO group peptidase (beta-lactamase class C family)